MKLLLLDIETSPHLAYVWRLFKENIPIQGLVDASQVLCWSAKWVGDSEIMFDSLISRGPKSMLRKIHKLLEEADAVITYNGARFDIPTLNKEFLLYGLPPPASYQQIDLYKTVRKHFRFPSNKLEYITKALGIGSKADSGGFDTWVGCMNRDPQAWKDMEEYNKQDVVLLEGVYQRVLPWISNHPNHGLHSDSMVCPTCGSSSLNRRGFAYTSSGRYQRYQCTDCQAWCRERKGTQEPTYAGL